MEGGFKGLQHESEAGLPTLRIFPWKYGIQKMIPVSPNFYMEFQNFRIFYGFCNFLYAFISFTFQG